VSSETAKAKVESVETDELFLVHLTNLYPLFAVAVIIQVFP
jgi:nitrate reductase NapE component